MTVSDIHNNRKEHTSNRHIKPLILVTVTSVRTVVVAVEAETDFPLPSYLDPIYEPHVIFDLTTMGVSLDLSRTLDGWKCLKLVLREHSLFAEFFEERQVND